MSFENLKGHPASKTQPKNWSGQELVGKQRRLAQLALQQDDPAGWLADMLYILGLHRTIEPDRTYRLT